MTFSLDSLTFFMIIHKTGLLGGGSLERFSSYIKVTNHLNNYTKGLPFNMSFCMDNWLNITVIYFTEIHTWLLMIYLSPLAIHPREPWLCVPNSMVIYPIYNGTFNSNYHIWTSWLFKRETQGITAVIRSQFWDLKYHCILIFKIWLMIFWCLSSSVQVWSLITS